MELILYYIVECKDLIISFLILMFLIAIICFLGIKNFSQEKREKVVIYGLFSKMNNIDILKISTVLIKTFLVFYGIIVVEQTKIFVSLIMIIILTIVYLVFIPKRIIYEIMCTVFYVAMIGFIYILNNYSITVENSMELLFIRILLMVFVLVFSGYLFFREIYLIPKDGERRRERQIEHEEKSEKRIDFGGG